MRDSHSEISVWLSFCSIFSTFSSLGGVSLQRREMFSGVKKGVIFLESSSSDNRRARSKKSVLFILSWYALTLFFVLE